MTRGYEFEYNGHQCHIYYDGFRPHFEIDGERVSVETVQDAIGHHAGRGQLEWKMSLKEYIDSEVDE